MNWIDRSREIPVERRYFYCIKLFRFCIVLSTMQKYYRREWKYPIGCFFFFLVLFNLIRLWNTYEVSLWRPPQSNASNQLCASNSTQRWTSKFKRIKIGKQFFRSNKLLKYLKIGSHALKSNYCSAINDDNCPRDGDRVACGSYSTETHAPQKVNCRFFDIRA